MRHESIIGFHIMPGAEGKRDLLYPLYKYKEDPPKQIWVDFGCGCNEMALNYLAEHYGDTEFFVDAFHNYSHKCPSCFVFPYFIDVLKDGNCNAVDRSICSRMECSKKGSGFMIDVCLEMS